MGCTLQKSFAFLIGVLLTLSVGWALPQESSQAQTSQNDILRKRVEEYYSLLQLGRYTQAEDYMTPDSKEIFRKVPKSPFLGYQISSVKFDSENKAAAVVVQVRAFMGGLSSKPVDMPYNTNWRLVEGTWYLTLPKDLPTSPINAIAKQGSPPSSPRPIELKFKGYHYNLAQIDQGQKKVARFPFTNQADHVVTITAVITGTPLLTVESYKKQYKPGESGEVAIDFTPVDIEKEYAQTVVLKSDPGGLITYLTVTAYVIPKPRELPKNDGTNTAPPEPRGVTRSRGQARRPSTSPSQ